MRNAFKYFLLASQLFVFTDSASARTRIEIVKDDVHGKSDIYAEVFARNYQNYTDENYISLICHSDGSLNFSWHSGGRFGDNLVHGDISYKLDAESAVDTNVGDLSDNAFKFYQALLFHKKLAIVQKYSSQSETYDIADFKAVAGPKSSFARQCSEKKQVSIAHDPVESPPVPMATGSVGEITPVARTHTLPPYPTISQRLGEEGITTMSVIVDAAGNATSVKIEKSSGSERLDQAALQYVQGHWRWSPSASGGAVSAVVPWNLKTAQ